MNQLHSRDLASATHRPPGPVRLVATDMDGTLLRSDQTISARTRDAIRAVHDAGVTVVAATGRGWRSAAPLLEPVPEIATAVCSNGALIRDLRARRNADTFPIARATLEVLVEAISAAVPAAGVAWELTDGFGFDAVYAGLLPTTADPPPDAVGEGLPVGDGLLKILLRDPELDETELLQALLPSLPAEVTATYSGVGMVEITGDGVHKAASLAVLCRRLRVPREQVVALGDNRNDVEMLVWAGRGVAMGNARPEAVAAADEQTDHHMDDGVAAVLERILAPPVRSPPDGRTVGA